MIEVAKSAGVSRTTASLVLSGKAEANRISSDTIEKVLQAARELDYSPNLLGRSLHHGTTFTFAFFNGFRNFQEDDLYMYRLMSSLQITAGKQGYDLLVHCDFEQSDEDIYGSMNGGRADGVLYFAPRNDDPLLPMLRQSRLPVVLLNVPDPLSVLPCVSDDLHQGMQVLAKELLDKGHRHLTYIHSPRFDGDDVNERFLALAKFIHTTDAQLKEYRYTYDQDLKEVIKGVVEQPDPPTALLFATDRIAYMGIEALNELGYQVPRDFSVVGYDGIRWPSSTTHVVTSAKVDFAAASQTALDLLQSITRREQRPPKITNVPVEFFPGTTVSFPRNSSNGAMICTKENKPLR